MDATATASSIDEAAASIEQRMIALRHALHRDPEVGLDLPRTQRKVLDELADLPLEITLGQDCSSITAVLRGSGGPDAPAVLLRADMDALAVDEQSGVPYASEVPGAMHACGHDLHTAMLAGAARILAERRHELPGDVVLMFQPGEEMHDGGAVMVREGVLDAAGRRADAAYALHVMSSRYPPGTIATREGAIMAAADGFAVTIHGRGGHSSAPHLAVDPVPVAAECVLALQSYVTRRVDVFDPIVVGIGHLAAGDRRAPNAIPETAQLTASVRSWSHAARAAFREEAARLVRSIAEAHGARAEVEHLDGYPVTLNDPLEARFAIDVAASLLGDDRVQELPAPLSGSEDFSRVLAEVPGAFLVLGAAPAGADPAAVADNHSPHAVFDDGVLVDGAAVYASLAARRLAQLATTRG
ncbi:hippurate hydrolase [Agrococcus baldri]|uniref:Hippurate hydrolase n=1 Tax=Agrococcus baldri TaxID=153730 RepID=A0AA94KZR3_9MICO|nr:M20 family metallopeptidase [Agrococcus baldri]SFS12125.1 hippurate hydrolase [Agrococcus baldri]